MTAMTPAKSRFPVTVFVLSLYLSSSLLRLGLTYGRRPPWYAPRHPSEAHVGCVITFTFFESFYSMLESVRFLSYWSNVGATRIDILKKYFCAKAISQGVFLSDWCLYNFSSAEKLFIDAKLTSAPQLREITFERTVPISEAHHYHRCLWLNMQSDGSNHFVWAYLVSFNAPAF